MEIRSTSTRIQARAASVLMCRWYRKRSEMKCIHRCSFRTQQIIAASTHRLQEYRLKYVWAEKKTPNENITSILTVAKMRNKLRYWNFSPTKNDGVSPLQEQECFKGDWRQNCQKKRSIMANFVKHNSQLVEQNEYSIEKWERELSKV